jgi:hypothetical protein
VVDAAAVPAGEAARRGVDVGRATQRDHVAVGDGLGRPGAQDHALRLHTGRGRVRQRHGDRDDGTHGQADDQGPAVGWESHLPFLPSRRAGTDPHDRRRGYGPVDHLHRRRKIS